MTSARKAASDLKIGDVMLLGTNRVRRIVKGISRAMPHRASQIAIIGERQPGSRSPVWYFDFDESIEVEL